MSTAIERFRRSLADHEIDPAVVAEIFAGYERITDRWKKERQAAFFTAGDAGDGGALDFETRAAVRSACACSTGGWREKAVMKVRDECAGRSLAEKVEALQHVTHMGRPVLHPDGTLTAGPRRRGGPAPAPAPCSTAGRTSSPSPSPTASAAPATSSTTTRSRSGVPLKIKEVVSSALASRGREPCRFVFEVVVAGSRRS